MPSSPTRDEALTIFDAARRNNRDFLALIPKERMTEPGATGPWSVKDVLAHVSAWRSRFIEQLEAVAAGHAEPPPPWPAELNEDDAINAWFYEQHQDDPLDEVLDRWDSSFDRLRAAFISLPDNVLYDPAYYPWQEGVPLIEVVPATYMDHFNEEHEPPLRAWLAETSK